MASQPSEERNRLRLQAWEQRNQETGHAKEQNPENVPLFREPYKTNKGDELSSRIQRMLGSYEENGTTEQLTSISSSITFPLANCVPPSTEHPLQQVQYMSTESQKSPSANASSTLPFNSPNHHEHVSNSSLNDNQFSHSSQHKISAHKDNVIRSHEKQYSTDAKPLPFLHFDNCDNTEPKDKRLITVDRLQHQGFTENTSNPAKSMEVFCKDASPPPNRNNSILPSQAFHPPLSSKQPNVAMAQKPTAYVRPMDGPDQVVSNSPELKPLPEHFSPLPELILNKSPQEKTTSLPLFLETATSDVQRVEDILREMTCSWPPLLTGIQTPCSEESSKSQFSVKEVEHVSSHPGQKHDQVPTTDPPHLHQSSSILSAEVHSSASSSDSESGSKSDSESATDELAQPVLSSSLKTEPAAISMAPGDWQLDKFIPFSQQNYRCKSQWAVHTFENLKPTDDFKHLSKKLLSPPREAPDQLSHKKKLFTDNSTPAQQSCTGSQETHYQQSSHNVLLKSTQPSDPVKPTLEENKKGVVSVHLDQTSFMKVKEPSLNNRPKGKTGRQPKKIKGCGVMIESEISDKHNIKKAESEVGPEVSRIQCTACMKPLSAASCTCICGKSKAETSHKKVTKLSQKNKCFKKKDSLNSSKGKQSLVVKINLSLLSRIPQTCSFTERPSVVIQHHTKTDKPHTVLKTSRKNDKVDHNLPKKKQKLECNNSTLLTPRPQSSYPSEAPEPKKSKKKTLSRPLSAPTGSTQKSRKPKLCTGDIPQSNKEDMKCPNTNIPRKSSGKCMEHSNLEKPTRESVSNRPQLKFEKRHYPVKHFIKEAKKLKHKADAEMDKLSKILNYLDAAMYFIESGIAMESDPQISMSSYTMFSETVELIKFVLKLINSEDPSPTENDLLALCLKCQALLQMAMFHHKQKTALKYSKTLIDYFNSSNPAEPSALKGKNTPMSQANTPNSSVTTPNHSSCGPAVGPFGGTVVVPQDIGQVAFTYVNITTLFLNAHNIWEQAEEYVNKGSGLLTELDTTMGALSFTSNMSSMVCYIRQGVHWLRMNCQKVK